MGVILRNSAGNIFSASSASGSITDISESKIQRTIVHDLPTANKDIIQDFGAKNRVFNFAGVVLSQSGVDFIRALPGTTGSITGSNDAGFTIIPSTTLFFSSVEFQDQSERPLERKFKVAAIEVL